jgi:hypothetical protein
MVFTTVFGRSFHTGFHYIFIMDFTTISIMDFHIDVHTGFKHMISSDSNMCGRSCPPACPHANACLRMPTACPHTSLHVRMAPPHSHVPASLPHVSPACRSHVVRMCCSCWRRMLVHSRAAACVATCATAREGITQQFFALHCHGMIMICSDVVSCSIVCHAPPCAPMLGAICYTMICQC